VVHRRRDSGDSVPGKEFLGRQRESVESHGFCVGALESKADGQLLGHCGIQYLGTDGDIEVGWWLAKRQWGQGFSTEAAEVP